MDTKEVSQAQDHSIIDTLEGEQAKSEEGSQISNFRDEWSNLRLLHSDIKDATDNFSESLRIGKGHYGYVYLAKLDGRKVAIKILDSTSTQGQQEFFREIEVLHNIRHPNIVKLIGACPEDHALVYEYLPNKSLEECLKEDPQILTWQMRTSIIYEMCTAVIHLHSKSVIHGDLKPANVLLDVNFKSKLTDFGLGRFIPEAMTTSPLVETTPMGTLGYIDPWFYETGILRPSSDLYSLGVSILRLLTGLQPTGLAWKIQQTDENSLQKMIDPNAGDWPFGLAKEMVYWSLQCCFHNEKSRRLLMDMSTRLKEILAEIETLQMGIFQPQGTGQYVLRRPGRHTAKANSIGSYSVQEIMAATNDLCESSKIGKGGGHGKVHKAELRGTTVAIKMFDSNSSQGAAEFVQEVDALCQMRHQNIVTLIGVCFEIRATVYEFLPNGTLEDCLEDYPEILTWQIRTRIIYNISLALKFIHGKSMVHGDTKPSSILLDHNFNGKLADFGLCEFLDEDMATDAYIETVHKRMPGYIDPQFLETKILRPGFDLYSFGVTILKILTRLPPVGLSRKVRDGGKSLLLNIIDPTAGSWPFELAKELANWSLQFCYRNEKSSELLGDMSTWLEDMLETLEGGRFEQRGGHDQNEPRGAEPPIPNEITQSRETISLEASDNEEGNSSIEAAFSYEASDEEKFFSKHSVHFLVYSYQEIRVATDHFSKLFEIGKGGYGIVYRANLRGISVAIKVLDSCSKQGQEEFFREVDALCQMTHPNIVTLIGACLEIRAIVYEFLPNGSLNDCLEDHPEILTWQIRTRIIHDISLALKYINGISVVHGDVKPCNILLDHNFNAKLTDFGLCRFLPGGMITDAYIETMPKGTVGYIDPQFMETCILRPGSDLYGFGVTILKILTRLSHVGLARKISDGGKSLLLEIIDPVVGSWPFELVNELVYWSLQCCYHNEKSSELLEDMSTTLEEMLTQIKTLGRQKFQPQSSSQHVFGEPEPPSKDEKAKSSIDGSIFSVYSFLEIEVATNGFSESSKVGGGGYGSVYKCELRGATVAIKMLDSNSNQGKGEFFQEVEVLCRLRHQNLVILRGACFKARTLVYDFLPNGSIEDCLKNCSTLLTWKIRTRIIYDVCLALEFLHSRSVVHSDIKPANILLDTNFNGKLADFGLCYFLPKSTNIDPSLQSTPRGTPDYMSLKYLETGIISPSCDLYSLGVTILELVTGRPPLRLSTSVYLANENSFREMIDPNAGSWPFELAQELAYWGLECCYNNEKSLELLEDMSKYLKEMLDEIETLQEYGSNEQGVTDRNRVEIQRDKLVKKLKQELEERWTCNRDLQEQLHHAQESFHTCQGLLAQSHESLRLSQEEVVRLREEKEELAQSNAALEDKITVLIDRVDTLEEDQART